MEETALLEGIGLTKGGIKVYFALLELGPSTTGEIIKKAKVSRSKVYEMLERLIDKGLVSFVIKENTKYFEAADPEHILHYVQREKSLLEEKEEELRKVLPALKEKQHFGRVPQTATVYEGIKGIKTMYSDVIYALKKRSKITCLCQN
ncbi:helix-turn-helix domain-containing protein [Candidatus Woesearchaeota archaeon]|nr:helix-turn-helix domain-containing protein [Candidatus Woesearchaeota archaeon]